MQAIQRLDAYIVTQTEADVAKTLISDLQVEAVITIPADFEQRYTSTQPDPISYEINNLNLDFTNDLRRSLPDAITQFYAAQPGSPVRIVPQETDLRLQDIGLVQFEVLPLLIQLLTSAGLLNTGLAASREWETLTIKELYQAPIARRDLIIGKTAAGWLIAMVYGLVTLGVATIAGYFHPTGLYWLSTLLTMALVALASAGGGVLLATLARREARVIAISTNLTSYLFFLSGGITVVAFLPQVIQVIARFIPTYYGVHALQMSVFYSSTDQLFRDTAVLAITAVVTVGLGAWAFRRRLLA